jgi:hypothetical protein
MLSERQLSTISASKACDEGSIPFTRSSDFNDLEMWRLKIGLFWHDLAHRWSESPRRTRT